MAARKIKIHVGDKERADIIEMRPKGVSYMDIMGIYCISSSTLKKMFEKAGLEKRYEKTRKNSVTSDLEQKIFQARTAGVPTKVLAKKYGFSEGTINRVAKRCGYRAFRISETGSKVYVGLPIAVRHSVV